MCPLAILLSLAIFTIALAAPNIEYYPTPKRTPAPTAASISAAPEPTKRSTTDELRRRSAIPALEIRGVLGKRNTCPLTGYYSCNNGYCCKDGTICYDIGLCYDLTVNYESQVSSILAAYTSKYTLDAYYSSAYASYMSELSSIYYGTTNHNSLATKTRSNAFQTNTASTDNSDSSYSYSDSSSQSSSGGSKGKIGIIVGATVGAIVLIILISVVGWFIYRNKKKTVVATAVQQPLMSQPPPPPPTQPPTPGPMPPYSPGPYGPYVAAAAAGKHDSVYGYQNYSTPPPGTVEMPGNQNMNSPQPYGQSPYPNGTQYQPPPLPVAGIVEAGGNAVYQQPAPQYIPVSTISPQSTGATSELSGQHMISPQTTGGTESRIPGAIPPPPLVPVYEMASSNNRQL